MKDWVCFVHYNGFEKKPLPLTSYISPQRKICISKKFADYNNVLCLDQNEKNFFYAMWNISRQVNLIFSLIATNQKLNYLLTPILKLIPMKINFFL